MSPENVVTDIVYWIRGEEHAELARLSIASVRKAFKFPHIVVYTDEPKETPVIRDVDWCVLPGGEPPMVANISAQVRHLVTAPYGQRVLFLDTDTLVQRPFPFDELHDLFVTWRAGQGVEAIMPYNYGVIGAIAGLKSIEAFQWMRARALRMSPQYQTWYANQHALFDLVGKAPDQGECSVRVPIRWAPGMASALLDVKQLPCSTWNYTPQGDGEDVTGKGILHMKGNRKHLMAAYAKEAA